MKAKAHTVFFLNSLVNSYSQIFFSNHRIFGIILLIVSFIDVYCGLAGLFSVIVANLAALWIGFNKFNIKEGFYGFNVLLVGLGLGIYYQPGLNLYILLFIMALMTLFISVAMEGVIGKYALPYLSIPFLFSIWLVTLATRQFDSLEISERGIYIFSELYDKGDLAFVQFYEYFNNLNIHESILIYFKSLGAIFFQYNVLAGFLIALGILIFSRIAFVLSLLGFYVAYLFYHFIGGDLSQLNYSYIGFNFILSSIALGGFFIIPSRNSFLWVILLIPVLVIVTAGSYSIFEIVQLPVYSLPFNLVVLMFLYILKFRSRNFGHLQPVTIQHYSPEKNFYAQLNYKQRFSSATFLNVVLPVFGKWTVTQAHDGNVTHKNDWRHAWDFEIVDEQGEKYKDSGSRVKDYYCFEKPVLAPADGTVVEVSSTIPDNKIGDMNLKYNWGNSVVIKHAEQLFSQLSHLKKDSVKVQVGDTVKRGDLIALVGNSGRSPIPHLHFQLQATPHIGSRTIDYPISYYILNDQNKKEIHFYDRPREGDRVSNIRKNNLIYQAFRFIPGRKMKFEIYNTRNNNKKTAEWEVQSDIYNNTYILDKNNDAMAFFKNDGLMHHFNNYKGKRNTLLYYFYLAAYKLSMGYYQDLHLKDNYRLDLIPGRFLLFFHDFVAPFFQFRTAEFDLQYVQNDSDLSSDEIKLESATWIKSPIGKRKMFHFELIITNDRLDKLIIYKGNHTITATCVD